MKPILWLNVQNKDFAIELRVNAIVLKALKALLVSEPLATPRNADLMEPV